MDLKKQILVALGLDKGEEVNMEWQAKSEDGSTILLPPGTYKTEDGVTFRVDEEGIVAEVLETEEVVEEEVEEEEMEEVVEPENLEARIKSLEDAVASLIGEPKEELAEEVEEVEERGTTPKSIKTTEVVEFSIEDLKAENERLKTELASAPASAPLDTNKFSAERATPTAQDFKRMTKQEKFLYNLHN